MLNKPVSIGLLIAKTCMEALINIQQFALFWNDKAFGHCVRCRLAFVCMQQRTQLSQILEKLPSELQGQFPSFNSVHPEDAGKGLAATVGGCVITGA